MVPHSPTTDHIYSYSDHVHISIFDIPSACMRAVYGTHMPPPHAHYRSKRHPPALCTPLGFHMVGAHTAAELTLSMS